jgi:hypothetical protein
MSESINNELIAACQAFLAAGEITAGEYNGAQRVAAMEDSVKKTFCKTTWSEVEAGDVALTAWESLGEIVEVEVELVEPWQGLDGAPLLRAKYLFVGARYSCVVDPEEAVYVQSRF